MYALVITIAAGIVILALLAGAFVVARRIAEEGGLPPIRGWRWFPSPLALLILLPLAGLLVWRALPVLFVIPFVLPFFWRGRRRGNVFFLRRDRPHRNGNGAIEGDKRRGAQ